MKCRILFSRKNKKNISNCHLLKFLHSMHCYEGVFRDSSGIMFSISPLKKKYLVGTHLKHIGNVLLTK